MLQQIISGLGLVGDRSGVSGDNSDNSDTGAEDVTQHGVRENNDSHDATNSSDDEDKILGNSLVSYNVKLYEKLRVETEMDKLVVIY